MESHTTTVSLGQFMVLNLTQRVLYYSGVHSKDINSQKSLFLKKILVDEHKKTQIMLKCNR